MDPRDETISELMDSHEGGVDDANINAANDDDEPTGRRASALDGDAIVASATIEVPEPLLNARAASVDAADSGTQWPNLDVLAHKSL